MRGSALTPSSIGPVDVRRATTFDLDMLVPLVQAFYQEDRHPFEERAARAALSTLVSDETLGVVQVALAAGVATGYGAFTFGFSLEFGGRDAFLDELFVAPAHRCQGIASRLLDALEHDARGLGIRAVSLEVDRRNRRARGLYESRGYRLRDRFCLLTKSL